MKKEFERIQNLINKQKEKVYSGELRSGDYYAYISGVLTSELSVFLERNLNTNLDLDRVRN